MREQQQPEQDYGQNQGYGPGWGRRGGHREPRPENRGFGPRGRGPWQGFGPQGHGQDFGPQGPQQGNWPGNGPQGQGGNQGYGPQGQGFDQRQGFDPRRGPFQRRGFGFGPGFRGWGRHQGFGHGFRGWGWGGRPQFSKEDQIAFLEKAQGFLEQRLAGIKAKLAELRQDQARSQESRPAGPTQTFNKASSQDTDVSML